MGKANSLRVVGITAALNMLFSSQPVHAQTIETEEPPPPHECPAGTMPVLSSYCVPYDSQPRPIKVTPYFEMFWHPDANDVWASWNWATNAQLRTACTLVAGDGCQMAVQGFNIAVVVGRDAQGNLFQSSDKSLKRAHAKLARFCAEKGTVCPVIHEFTPSKDRKGNSIPSYHYSGPAAVNHARRRFAAGETRGFGNDDQLWLASGVTNEKGARIMPRMYCLATITHRNGSGDCHHLDDNPAWFVESGYALVFRDSSGQGGTVVGTDMQDLERQAKALCLARSKAPCSAAVMIDSRIPFTGLVKLSKLPAWPQGGRPASFDPAASWLEWQVGRPVPSSANRITPIELGRAPGWSE